MVENFDDSKNNKYYYCLYEDISTKYKELSAKYEKINVKIVKLREYQKVKGYESYLKKKDTYVHCEHCKLDVKFRSFNTHKKSVKHMNALKLSEALKKIEENNQPVKKKK